MNKIDLIRFDNNFERHLSKWSAKIGVVYDRHIRTQPKNSSQDTKNELLYLEKLTSNASQEDIDRALLLDVNLDYDFIRLTEKYSLDYPKDQIDNAWSIVSEHIMYYKWLLNRPRPKQIMDYYNIKIKTNTPESAKTPSYPSGHTAYAETVRIVIQRMYPMANLSKGLSKAVENMAMSRMILGVHYPSDNAESLNIVGRLMAKIMTKS